MTYTREEIDAAIEAAAEAKGEPLAKEAYRDFREAEGGQDARIPSLSTITYPSAGYDSWREACAANDVEAYDPGAGPPAAVAISSPGRGA